MDDGIKIHYRDYGDPGTGKTPVICIPGLNRSSLGFDRLASALCRDRRVICPDLRGRGKSDYDPNYENYKPGQYVRDIMGVLKDAGIDRVAAIGTSLGGIVTMVGAAMNEGMWAGAVLNDIGPVVETKGLDRIASYTGKTPSPANWDEAVAICKQSSGPAFPDYTEEEWLFFAQCAYATNDEGNPVDNYDFNISKTFGGSGGGDMWSLFEKLHDVPIAVVWGNISDILSQDIANEMVLRHPDAELVTVPNVGHAPNLDEAESRAGIQRLLEKVDT
jgi:pimeloyl-ACP methyl ester carboxylesterase